MGNECQEKCPCGEVCRRIDDHVEHQCQKCNYKAYWRAEDAARALAGPGSDPRGRGEGWAANQLAAITLTRWATGRIALCLIARIRVVYILALTSAGRTQLDSLSTATMG